MLFNPWKYTEWWASVIGLKSKAGVNVPKFDRTKPWSFYSPRCWIVWVGANAGPELWRGPNDRSLVCIEGLVLDCFPRELWSRSFPV